MALVQHILVRSKWTPISVIFILQCDVEYMLPSIGPILQEHKLGLLFVFLA